MSAEGPPDQLLTELKRVRRRLARWRTAGLGGRWVVAVSGGGDSVALLRILHAWSSELRLELSVAHLDHGARGEAAKADAQFVANLASALGLTFDLGRWQPNSSRGFEAGARCARYAWLAEVAQSRGASVVAVAHTADDQAETILHRILRGTGLRGLAGMSPRRRLAAGLVLARPFLGVRRNVLREYLKNLGQPFREDASNADLTRTRARIRHDLLPRLAAQYNPRVEDSIVRLGQLAAAAEHAVASLLRASETNALASFSPDHAVIQRARLAGLPPYLRAQLLRHVWRRIGWPEAQMDACRWRRLSAIARRERGRFSVGHGVDVVLTPELYRFERAQARCETAPLPEPCSLPIPGMAPWGSARIVATLDPGEARDETIDRETLALPLSVRPWVPGDRFGPLGMDQGTVSVASFLYSRDVPKAERSRTPLVCDREGIVWVVGHRIAHRVRLTATTREKLGLRWETAKEGETAFSKAPNPC
jgi:tRNA(Ile)-lysidine synthase